MNNFLNDFSNKIEEANEISLGTQGETLLAKFCKKTKDKPLPKEFKEPRAATFAIAKIDKEKSLFSSSNANKGNLGQVIINGISHTANELDFHAFVLAASKILYNQSYQNENTDTFSGVTRQEARKFNEETGIKRYNGVIVCSITDLCRHGYGTNKPTDRQRKKMSAVVDYLHNKPVKITFPNGDSLEKWLCVKTGKYTYKNGKAILYELTLNPIFCEEVESYSTFPQDIASRLYQHTKRIRVEHYRLLKLLGVQDKRKPFIRLMPTIIKELGLEESYKSQRIRTERDILGFFNTMKKIGVIDSYKEEYITATGNKKILNKITCYFNRERTQIAKL